MSAAPIFDTLALGGEDMARRRLQQKGSLSIEGGWWKLRWRVDAIDVDGQAKRTWGPRVTIGPAANGLGIKPLTKKEATRKAWDDFLSKLDQNQQTPMSMMTVEQFVERKFQPGHVKHLKRAGRKHYELMLKRIMPALGKLRLCDVRRDHVQALVNAVLDSKRSWQTAKHVKTAVSAVFTFAEAEDCYSGVNPAKYVRMPEETRVRESHALTFDQARELFEALPEELRRFCLTLTLTSMNVSELLGLKWRYCNLSGEWAYIDGQSVPPWHIAVRHQWYRGEYGSVKAKPRNRDIPMPAAVREIVEAERKREKFNGADDWVFVARNGHPFDAGGQMRRHLKPIAAALGMPWISWHVFRHTHASWTKEAGLDDFYRMRLMGHGDLKMTSRYTHAQSDQQLAAMETMADKLTEKPKPEPTPGKVISMKRRAG